MQRYGMTLMLKDDDEIVDRYKEYHRKAWPEVVSRLHEIGITEMRIYLRGRRMFMYMEADDGFSPELEFPKLTQDPRYREWDELMRTFHVLPPHARPPQHTPSTQAVSSL